MVESNRLRLPFWEPWFWEASIINIDGEVCFRQFWGFHFGNPNVEEPNLSRLWALKECCVFCSCIGLDFGPGKTLVILLNEKTKTPATSISLTCIGFIFRLGELSALYIYFGKFQKVLFLTFASCSPYFTQKLLETVGSLGCSAPSFQQFIPSICKDEEEQLTPFRNRAPTVNQFDVCRIPSLPSGGNVPPDVRMARCDPSFQQLIGFFSVSNNSVNARSTVKQKQWHQH